MPIITQYVVNAEDEITHVSDEWIEFAISNEASELTRDHVLSRSLWDFIEGSELKQLYASLLRRVRVNKLDLQLPFRCDSPDRARFMTLWIHSQTGDSVLFEARLDRAVDHPRIWLLDSNIDRSSEFLSIGSMCKAIRTEDDRWLDLEAAVRDLGLMGMSGLPRLSHGLCPKCESVFGETASTNDPPGSVQN